jgi:hypothetical protein
VFRFPLLAGNALNRLLNRDSEWPVGESPANARKNCPVVTWREAATTTAIDAVGDSNRAHKSRGEFGNRTHAALLHADLKFCVQDLEHPFDAGFAEGAEAP